MIPCFDRATALRRSDAEPSRGFLSRIGELARFRHFCRGKETVGRGRDSIVGGLPMVDVPPRIARQGRGAALAIGLALGALALSTPSRSASNWAIDPARTHTTFDIDAVAYPRTHGEFRKFAGTIAVDLEHPARSRVSFHVEAQSVDVGSASFNDYVRSAVLLDAPRFPTIDFASTSVEKLDERRVRVTGDLTLLGVTRPLGVDVEVERRGEGTHARLGFTARARIDRLEFGMNSGFPVISRDVDLVISSEASEF
jgi:polyisoprenoid-binding protein YceI